jgi:hypothetical protein
MKSPFRTGMVHAGTGKSPFGIVSKDAFPKFWARFRETAYTPRKIYDWVSPNARQQELSGIDG